MEGEVRINEFVKFEIKLETKFYGVKEFETEFRGEKRLMNKGQLFIKLNGIITYDYKRNFKGKFAETLLHLLVNVILKNYYDVKYVDRLYYDVYNMHNMIKELLYMESATNAY
ncbi:MAG: hypothetical protein ACLFN8_05100 [Candidatus Woesearchaeota archaeon]